MLPLPVGRAELTLGARVVDSRMISEAQARAGQG
jgi:hypothetical protein